MSQSRRRPASLLSLDVLENSLFTPSNKNTFLFSRKSDNLETAFNSVLSHANEKQLQRLLAPFLREATIRYLRTGNSEYAIHTRTSYLEIYLADGALEQLLDKQAQDEVWAGMMEAGALGSLLNITVLVTPINHGKEQTIFAAYMSPDPDAPVIHLYNRDNVHWFYHEGRSSKTFADGNCFYNAFAQGLRHCALKLKKQSGDKLKLSTSENKLYQYQEQLLASIKNKAEPTSIAEIIAHIPDEEIEAKRADNELAEQSTKNNETESERPLPSQAENIPLKHPIFNPPIGNDYAKTFYDALLMMAEEANKLTLKSVKNKKFTKAANAAKTLVRNLNTAAVDHYEGAMVTKDFIKTCNSAIKRAEPDLAHIAGWKRIISNVALAIVGIGIGYLIAGLINKAMTGEFLFFRSKTSTKFKKLKETIQPTHRFKPGK